MKQVSTSLLENSKGAISNSTPTNNISEILKNSTTVINPQQDNEQTDLIAARDAFIEDYIREHTPTDKRISLESYNFIRKAAENEWEALNQNKAPSINEYGAHAQGSLRDYLQDSGVNAIIQEKIKFLEDLQILTKLLAYEGLASYSYVLSRKTARILKYKETLKGLSGLKIKDLETEVNKLNALLQTKKQGDNVKGLYDKLRELNYKIYCLKNYPRLIKEYEEEADKVKQKALEADLPNKFPKILTPKGTIRKTYKDKLTQGKHWSKPIFTPRTEEDAKTIDRLNHIVQVPSLRDFYEYLGFNTNPLNENVRYGVRNIKMVGKKGVKGEDDVLLPYNIGWSVSPKLTPRKDSEGKEIPGSELEHTPVFEKTNFKHSGVTKARVNKKLVSICDKEINEFLWQVTDTNYETEIFGVTTRKNPEDVTKKPKDPKDILRVQVGDLVQDFDSCYKTAKKILKAVNLGRIDKAKEIFQAYKDKEEPEISKEGTPITAGTSKYRRLYRKVCNNFRKCEQKIAFEFDQEIREDFKGIAYGTQTAKGLFGEPIYSTYDKKYYHFLPGFKVIKTITSSKAYFDINTKVNREFLKESIKLFKGKNKEPLDNYRFMFEALYRKYINKNQNMKGIHLYDIMSKSQTKLYFNDSPDYIFTDEKGCSLDRAFDHIIGVPREDITIFDSNTKISTPMVEAWRFFKDWEWTFQRRHERVGTKEDCYKDFCDYMNDIQKQCLKRKDGLGLAYVYEFFKNNFDATETNKNLETYIKIMTTLLNCIGTSAHDESYRLIMDIDNIKLPDGTNLATKSLLTIMKEFDIKPKHILYIEGNGYSKGLHVIIPTKEPINYERAKNLETYINKNLKVDGGEKSLDLVKCKEYREKVPVRVEICKFYNGTQFLREPLSYEYLPLQVELTDGHWHLRYQDLYEFAENFLFSKPTEIPYSTAKFREITGIKKKDDFMVEDIEQLKVDLQAEVDTQKKAVKGLVGRKKTKREKLNEKTLKYTESLDNIGNLRLPNMKKRSKVIELKNKETGESLGHILTTTKSSKKAVRLNPYKQGKRWNQMRWEIPYLKVELGMTLEEVAHSLKERAGTSKDLNAWSEHDIINEIKDYYNKCNYWEGSKSNDQEEEHKPIRKDMLISNIHHLENGSKLLFKIINPDKQSDIPAPADILYEAFWKYFRVNTNFACYRNKEHDPKSLRARFHRNVILPTYFLEIAGLAIDSVTNPRLSHHGQFNGLVASRTHFASNIRNWVRAILFSKDQLEENYKKGTLNIEFKDYIDYLRQTFRKDFKEIIKKNKYKNILEFECDYVFGKLTFDPRFYQKFMVQNIFEFMPYAKEGKNKAHYDQYHAVTYYVPDLAYIQEHINLALLKICQGTRTRIKCKDSAIAHNLTTKVFLNDKTLEQDVMKDSKEKHKIFKKCERFLKKNHFTKKDLVNVAVGYFVKSKYTNDNKDQSLTYNIPEYTNIIYRKDPKANTKLGKAIANLCLIASLFTLSFSIQENCIPFSDSQISTDKQERYIMYQTSINPPDLLPSSIKDTYKVTQNLEILEIF